DAGAQSVLVDRQRAEAGEDLRVGAESTAPEDFQDLVRGRERLTRGSGAEMREVDPVAGSDTIGPVPLR
ncbi:hypothetical protein, partial [Nocardia tengchongensis]|uniref:hypothetical protein n=1 Tax=Nocardia tengchongensis TaxID=2055889 RepID=UPI0036C032C4